MIDKDTQTFIKTIALLSAQETIKELMDNLLSKNGPESKITHHEMNIAMDKSIIRCNKRLHSYIDKLDDESRKKIHFDDNYEKRPGKRSYR